MEDHGASDAGQLPKPGLNVVCRKAVAKERVAQGAQNEIGSVQRLMTACVARRILNSAHFWKN